ncbi:hypothetical protein H312_03256, partial [Anncaliia algerae PRA339]
IGKSLVLPKLHCEKIRMKKGRTQLLNANDILLIKQSKKVTIYENGRSFFIHDNILKCVKFYDRIVLFTKDLLFFVSGSTYFFNSKDILDICSSGYELYILKQNRLEVFNTTKRIFILKRIKATKICCIFKGIIAIAESKNIFLVDLNKNETKHIFKVAKNNSIIEIKASKIFYDIPFTQNNIIENAYGEDVLYILTNSSIVYLNVLTLETYTVFLDNMICKLSVGRNFVVLKFRQHIIIFDKFLKTYKKISNKFDDFIATDEGFAYIINNMLLFTYKDDVFELSNKENIYNTCLNTFFTKSNFSKFKNDYMFDCSDSQIWNDEYGKILQNISENVIITKKEFKSLKMAEKFKTINNLYFIKNKLKTKRKLEMCYDELLKDLNRFEDYFENLDAKRSKYEKNCKFRNALNIDDNVLFRNIQEDYKFYFEPAGDLINDINDDDYVSDVKSKRKKKV